MIDIFAIADIRYEILSYLDHFELMRACCCKDWLVTSQRILSTVTHVDIINFGYMAVCPNLVSIKILDTMVDIHHKNPHMLTFPNIRTVKHTAHDDYDCVNWDDIFEIFTNIENVSIHCKCEYYSLFHRTDLVRFLKYPKIKRFTLRHVFVYVDSLPLNCSILVTLIDCKIHPMYALLLNTHNLTMLNCTNVIMMD
jgi:hypothetical protein